MIAALNIEAYADETRWYAVITDRFGWVYPDPARVFAEEREAGDAYFDDDSTYNVHVVRGTRRPTGDRPGNYRLPGAFTSADNARSFEDLETLTQLEDAWADAEAIADRRNEAAS